MGFTPVLGHAELQPPFSPQMGSQQLELQVPVAARAVLIESRCD